MSIKQHFKAMFWLKAKIYRFDLKENSHKTMKSNSQGIMAKFIVGKVLQNPCRFLSLPFYDAFK